MDKNVYDMTALEKKVDYVFDRAKTPCSTIVFSTDDFKKESNTVFTAHFTSLIGSNASFCMKLAGAGRMSVYVNDVLCRVKELVGSTEYYFDAFVPKGEVVLKADFTNVTGFSFSRLNVCGYVKMKNYDSKIYAVNSGEKSLISFYDGLNGTVKMNVVGESLDATVVSASCRGAALSSLGGDLVLAMTLHSDKLTVRLIDIGYADVMSSVNVSLDGARQITGASGGKFYVVKSNGEVREYTINSSLAFAVRDTGVYAEKVIAAPTASEVIYVAITENHVRRLIGVVSEDFP